jgi:hypothetical protein
MSTWLTLRAHKHQLEATSSGLKELFDRHASDHEQITWYLEQEVKQKDDVVSKLTHVAEQIQRESAHMTRTFEDETEKDKIKYSALLDDLEKDYRELHAKCSKLSLVAEEKVLNLIDVVWGGVWFRCFD